MKGNRGGADSYWPGFVDALTNVVIAMIFVVVVLALSLTFAAQIMAKRMLERAVKEFEVKAAQSEKVTQSSSENIVQDEKNRNGNSQTINETRILVKGSESSTSSGGKLKNNSNTIEIGFESTALTLSESASSELKNTLTKLGPSSLNRNVEIVGKGPSMSYSDNQRTAYIRVMATRNVLLEAGYSASKITVSIDTETDAPSSSVTVLFKD